MLVFDRWGPLAEGSVSREDNPYALDATEGGNDGLDDSEPPSPVESSAPVRRRSMVVSSDDETEHSDAGPQASPSQHAEVVAGDAGETQERSSEALPAGSGPGDALKMMPPREAPLRRPLPRRKWVFIARYGTSPHLPSPSLFLMRLPCHLCGCAGNPRNARRKGRGQ